MFKIKDDINLIVLETYGFYVQADTYKRDVGENSCIGINKRDRVVSIPKVKKIKSIREIKNTLFFMFCDGILEKI